MNNSIFQHDLNMFKKEIYEITKITWKHPIDWSHILEALKEAEKLIDEVGPDGLLIAIINEKERRGLDFK